MPHERTLSSTMLSERYIQDSFHSYLKSSLTQAKIERLLDADVLSSAEADLMITGPALCLYFAALRSTTDPPSVPLPRSRKGAQPRELSYENCPPLFISFLRVWASTVPQIQSLIPEHQHDLARIICGLPPLSKPVPPELNGIAADLRAVAIEISQRRSFQERFSDDLQAALDSGGMPSPKKASFVPPPGYDEGPSSSTPRSSLDAQPPPPPPHSPSRARAESPLPPLPPEASGSGSTPSHRHHDSPSTSQSHRRTTSNLSVPSSPGFPPSSRSRTPPSPSPSILSPTSPAIDFIRETLYAALADVLERLPSLRLLLKADPPRAYFASVALAVLEVSTTAVTDDGTVVGVLGKTLGLEECPAGLRPFMDELVGIGREARKVEEEDTEEAMRHAQRGEDIPVPRLDRVKEMLERGVGASLAEEARSAGRREGEVDTESRRRSVEGRAVAFMNRINALSLGMTRLRAFRERQGDVFKVLSGIGAR